jgi:hypothetical protein
MSENTEKKFVDSTSDARVVNNSDNSMRHNYRVLNDEEKANMKAIKDAGLAFKQLIDSIGSSADLTVAKRKIQESVFWSVYHITG